MTSAEKVGVITYYHEKRHNSAADAATVSRARALLFREGVLAATLNEQTVGRAPRFTLTDKVDGKTRCLYVPAALAPEVRRKTENWKALKGVLLEMSEQTRDALVEEITALTGRPTVRRAASGSSSRGSAAGRKAAKGARPSRSGGRRG